MAKALDVNRYRRDGEDRSSLDDQIRAGQERSGTATVPPPSEQHSAAAGEPPVQHGEVQPGPASNPAVTEVRAPERTRRASRNVRIGDAALADQLHDLWVYLRSHGQPFISLADLSNEAFRALIAKYSEQLGVESFPPAGR